MSLVLVPIPWDAEKLTNSSRHWMPFVESIAKYRECSTEGLVKEIYRGFVNIVLIWDAENREAKALVGIRGAHRGDVPIGEIIWCTGENRSEWWHLLPELERYMKEHLGNKIIMPIVRPGYVPDLKKAGYRVTHIVLEKEV